MGDGTNQHGVKAEVLGLTSAAVELQMTMNVRGEDLLTSRANCTPGRGTQQHNKNLQEEEVECEWAQLTTETFRLDRILKMDIWDNLELNNRYILTG